MSMGGPLVYLLLSLNSYVPTKITEQDDTDLVKDENLKPKQVCSLVFFVNFEHILQGRA